MLKILLIFVFCALIPGALSAQPSDSVPQTGASDSTYKLGVADKIQINIFNQPDLSGEYQLDGEGRIFMPLIGRVEAVGLTAAELERALVDKLKPDYLVNPKIFIQVGIYKPYYLVGEALGTGPFPYVSGMTYLQAIANAGGFTYRAKKDSAYVIRADDPTQSEIKLDINEKVQPGDIIRIAERLF